MVLADISIRIMFMHEFPVIDSAGSLDQLRMRLKENELEQYGEPFTPDFVYDVIRRLPRFSTMRVSSGVFCVLYFALVLIFL
jgi:ubiquitin carboxyl-terminal hydrolase 10